MSNARRPSRAAAPAPRAVAGESAIDRASALHDGAPRAVDDFTDEPALHDVLCDPGRADICRNSARLMKDNARLIVENPGHLVLVDGHTD